MSGASKKWLLIGVGIMVAFLVSIVAVRYIRSTRIVAHITAPNGVEFCIVQRFTTDGPFFNTSAYYRWPGGLWGRHYYDHEDLYWRKGRSAIDEKSGLIKVYRGNELTATFNYRTEAFTIIRWNRTTTAPTMWLNNGENPWDPQ